MNIPPMTYELTADEIAEKERKAAMAALDAVANDFYGYGWIQERICAFATRFYAPTPRSVTLPCGDVVTLEDWRFIRKYPNGSGFLASGLWPQLVRVSDTGADFDALKAFAASVEAK